MSYREVEKVLLKNGWDIVRIRGSHYRFKHSVTKKNVTVPHHKSLGKGLIISIEKSTGLSLR